MSYACMEWNWGNLGKEVKNLQGIKVQSHKNKEGEREKEKKKEENEDKSDQTDSKDPRMWTTKDIRWGKREIGATDKLKRELREWLNPSAYRKHKAFLLWFYFALQLPKSVINLLRE